MQYTTRELVDYYNTENHRYKKKKKYPCARSLLIK